MRQIHPLARTNPCVRAQIKASTASINTLAECYNISRATARKWKQREEVQDRSHRTRHLQTTLTQAQEILVVELRRTRLLPRDDLLVITREFINPATSRSALDRCLRRHGVANLKDRQAPSAEGEIAPKKTLKDYTPGFVHIDIKYLPQMPDESARRDLFVAIDRATRWVWFRIYPDQSEKSSTDFLRRLKRVAPIKIQTVLTDNGSQFTDRFTNKNKQVSGQHAFDQACATHGMIERFNGPIADLIRQTRFASASELETTLSHYFAFDNHSIPQRALGHLSPVQALKQWRIKQPELFSKRLYKKAGLGN